jgi:hypothetical protein
MSPYPKKAKGENTNADSMATAPSAPQVGTVAAPQVTGARGGAPRIAKTAVDANNDLRYAWKATGSHDAMYNRTFQRNQLGSDPGAVGTSLRQYWAGAAAGTTQAALPTPAGMTLEESQKYLADLTSSIKGAYDEKFKALTNEEKVNSRFWRAYQDYPEGMAAMVARRVWTNQMVGQGPVADWLQWLKG